MLGTYDAWYSRCLVLANLWARESLVLAKLWAREALGSRSFGLAKLWARPGGPTQGLPGRSTRDG